MRLNTRGAASILVILIIVVLATFGGIALTAGWTNKQLSIKAAQSKTAYYALDSAAEEMVAEIDNVLFSVADATINYLNNIPSADKISESDKQGNLNTLFSYKTEYINTAVLRTKKINEVFVRNYFYYSANSLEIFAAQKGLTIKYSDGFESADDFLDTDKSIPKTGCLTVAFSVSEGTGSGAKNIDIEIAVAAPNTQPEILDAEKWRTEFTISQKENISRYEIVSWKLWHNPIDYIDENPKFG